MFAFNINQQSSKTILILNGDMDIDVTEIMQDEIAPSLINSTDIEINFQNISFVDSSGIGLLISLINDIKNHGNHVVVTNLQADVMQVFSLLQLPEILGYEVFADFAKIGDE